MALYCGIDLHSNNAVYAVTNEDDKTVYRKRLPNDLATVLRELDPFREELAAMAVESTYNWYWLVDGLQENGYPVRLANPAAIEQYDGLKNADDDSDAWFLAHLCRLGILPAGYIYPKEERPVRDLLRRRMLLVQQRTALILSVRNLFARQLGQAPSMASLLRLSPAELVELVGPDDCLQFVLERQIEMVRFQSRTILMFERKAEQMVRLRPEFEHLMTIPGVGIILALTIMLETGDIGRFAKVGDYTSYCRCVRAKHLSNGRKKADNNRKNGNRYLSWAFVEAVHHAIRHCLPAKKWYQRKASAKNGALATKALASKWSKAAYYVLRDQQAFDIGRVFG